MRVSTTTIESFRLFMAGDWMKESELIATIRGEFVPTHRVDLGYAFGKVIEKPDRYRVDGGYQFDNFYFIDEVMDPALALFDRRGVFEAKAVKTYGSADVVAKVDQVLGARIIENKATLGTFDFEKYADSYQWRFCLDIFEALSVTYHIFCLGEDKEGVIRLRGIESFNLFPYAELHQDCRDMVERFTDYVKARGLDGHLREMQQKWG